MCGIVGFLGESPAAKDVAQKMTGAIEHRGPDGQNVWLAPHDSIALGQARLAVIDVSDAGAQPMHSHSGRYTISFNGEIYNHLSLRKELEQRGDAPNWRGTSDTESLLAGIDHWGIEKTLQKCIGMFALAVWDDQLKCLTLARDRFGEKPLYYMPSTGGVVFGSELSAIELHPRFDKGLSQQAVRSLAESNSIPAPASIYEGVFKLLPGSFIVYNLNGFVETKQWWSPIDSAIDHQNDWQGTFDEAAIELEALLDQSISRQLVADVPLGAFLSGGIDSSLVVALMKKNHSSAVKTFSLGFNNVDFDEAKYASKIAQHLGTDHNEYYVSDDDVSELVPKMANIYSEPFADSSQLPTYLVSKLSRAEVTVALTGDAGDEIFAGYNRHLFARNSWPYIKKIPLPMRRLAVNCIDTLGEARLDQLSKRLPGTSNWTRVGEKLKRSGHVLSATTIQELYLKSTRLGNTSHLLEDSESGAKSACPQAELVELINSKMSNSLQNLDEMRWMMVKDQMDYLPNDILAKVDRASMACALETRAPFLDHTVVDFANSVPSDMLVRKRQGKQLLRAILGKYVPESYFDRPKMGFSIPIHDMLRGPLKEWAAYHLSEISVSRAGGFEPKRVSKLWADHLTGDKNNVAALWPILMFQSWFEERRV